MEFSFKSRETALRRFREETFDLLVVGGGITGAAVARDATSRGLKVALVEQNDFAHGTSSRSSKLIHGGLRYLENFELGLVFESLAERALLLKTMPHMVRPLRFLMPVYRDSRNGRFILSCGLWLYDILALFRSPEFHDRLSARQFLQRVPFLKSEGLVGGFQYFDASMWDDVLTVETIRSAHSQGAAVANYVQAVGPLWTVDRVSGYRVRDLEAPAGQGEIDLRAHRVVVCGGPYTDLLGKSLSSDWRRWLSPSRGVHLVFDLKRIPVPGAVVMTHPTDGRISFAIPRPDFGNGVVLVGTTDGPSPDDPDKTEIEASDIHYLLDLLNLYFPSLGIKASDIHSAYVGVRPLIGPEPGRGSRFKSLQKVSREHRIGRGPGGVVIVAGGKYTTHRRMAEEIVDYALKTWEEDWREGRTQATPSRATAPHTAEPLNPMATREAIEECRARAIREGTALPESLLDRYGAEAMDILEIQSTAGQTRKKTAEPEGFPFLAAQLRLAARRGMVLHLEDFYFRRSALFLARADHGLPWVDELALVLAEELGGGETRARAEAQRVREEIERREAWRQSIQTTQKK